MGEEPSRSCFTLNSQVTRLTENKTDDTIKEKVVDTNYTFEMYRLFPINTRVFGYVVVQLFMWYVYNSVENVVTYAHASKIIHC